jgi:hypothetical protein
MHRWEGSRYCCQYRDFFCRMCIAVILGSVGVGIESNILVNRGAACTFSWVTRLTEFVDV